MKKIVIIVISYIIFSVLFDSCWQKPDYYKLSSINSKLFRITGFETVGLAQIQTYSVEDVNVSEDTLKIRYDSIGIEINTENLLAQSTVFQHNSFGISPVYALEKVIEYEKIVDIIITSDKDYNSFYPAGTDLKQIFMISEEHNVSATHISNFLQNYDARIKTVFLKLLYAPEKEEVHTIKIKYKTENNNEYETTVKSVMILK